jgi:predicted aspartyl protease
MKYRRALLVLGVALLTGSCWLLAQPARSSFPADADTQLTVCPAGDSAVLLDRGHGKTWLLQRRGEDRTAWLPILRVDSEEEATRWRKAAPPEDRSSKGSAPVGIAELLKERGYVAIALDRFNSGYLAVEAHINQKKIYLMIDTGAPNTHLDRERTKQLQLRWQDAAEKGSVPALRATTAHCVVEKLEIGPLQTGRLRVGAHDLSQINQMLEIYLDPGIDGVLGADVFSKYESVIDYSASVLYVLPRKVM